MFKLKFQGAFGIPQDKEAYIISLTDEKEERAISILTSRDMAYTFRDMDAHDKKLISTLPFLLSFLLDQEGGFHHCIQFHGIKDRGIKAELVDLISQKNYPINPDEAVLLARIAELDMFADIDTFRYFSTPFGKDSMRVALPIMSLPDKMLQMALKDAINTENYESAGYIRDEIKRREQISSSAKGDAWDKGFQADDATD